MYLHLYPCVSAYMRLHKYIHAYMYGFCCPGVEKIDYLSARTTNTGDRKTPRGSIPKTAHPKIIYLKETLTEIYPTPTVNHQELNGDIQIFCRKLRLVVLFTNKINEIDESL